MPNSEDSDLTNFEKLQRRENYIHPDSNNFYNYSLIHPNSDKLKIEILQGLLWSIGILIMKYIINLNDHQIENFTNNYMIGVKDLIEIKGINKILMKLLVNLFDYEDKRFSMIYIM